MRYCDGLSRRSFVRVGALGIGGLTLPHLLQAEASQRRRKHKSVIMVYLTGGLAHQDTFDLKPDAPEGIRGEFKPIATSVPGTCIGELLPKLAARAHRYSLLRSIVGLRDEHSSFQNLTGYPMDQTKREGRPSFGSVIARAQGPVDPVVPAFVDLFPTMQHRPYNSPGAGYLGRAAQAVRVDGNDLAVMKPGPLSGDLTLRQSLLQQLEAQRPAGDTYHQRAFDVLTSSKLVEAIDVSREPVALRDRYGRGSTTHLGDGAPMWNDQLLMARRLAEAGARVVTVAYGFWDTHGGNFKHLRKYLPLFDTGISALVDDIYERGLDQDVSVIVWGEFGRTPKINKDAGRDHWPRVNGALMFGGGLRPGQVIGTTDKLGDSAKDQPIPYLDVLATVYHAIGLDPHSMITDISGRPTPILPSTAQPIRQLL